ncbi:glycosyltransferase [Rhodobacter sp. Har01]|uniref:glycosyltransferase family 2 protein n=1 Tax=Rhodobacter sp. Har01 TaxID=2883999 RepID=UPI001D073246|nr:glycosyltransferase family 2 protein [Rhodobacter sp. Har01]MCB6179837.1 glycosyltransferase [Rhodobacter sp. Har01]
MGATVSVILPVYNRSASLADSMRSVLDQSYRDLELIVVDDASTEDLRPIVEGLGDPRVRFLRRERNGGASAARNTGLAAAQGRFIAFQDSDDLWLPNKLKRQMDLLEQMPEVGVVTHSKVLYGGGPDGRYGVGLVSMRPPPDRVMKPGEDQVKKYLVENRISLQNALFRRDCYPEPMWFDDVTRSNADWAFTSSLAQHTRIAEFPDPVVMAFSSPDGISKLKRAKAIGLIRIVKRNRAAYARYPAAYGMMMWRIGRILARHGKKRMARKFYAEGLKNDPGFLWRSLMEKLGLCRQQSV